VLWDREASKRVNLTDRAQRVAISAAGPHCAIDEFPFDPVTDCAFARLWAPRIVSDRNEIIDARPMNVGRISFG